MYFLLVIMGKYFSLEFNPKDKENNAIFYLPVEGKRLAPKDCLAITFKNTSNEKLDLLFLHVPKFNNFYDPIGHFMLGNLLDKILRFL